MSIKKEIRIIWRILKISESEIFLTYRWIWWNWSSVTWPNGGQAWTRHFSASTWPQHEVCPPIFQRCHSPFQAKCVKGGRKFFSCVSFVLIFSYRNDFLGNRATSLRLNRTGFSFVLDKCLCFCFKFSGK